MGKTQKDSAAADRRSRAQALRSQQRKSERRRTIAIVAACAAAGVAIIAAGAYPLIKQSRTEAQFSGKGLAEIGASEAAASCSPVSKTPATGGSDHRPEGSEITYETTPPAFGPHYATPAAFSRKFYTTDDRPPVPTLVHNLEHGYSILWYDDTIAGDAQELAEVKAIARMFENDSGLAGKFVAAPWADDDGGALPDGKHIAVTHWSVGEGNGSGDQVGVSEYCARPSGEVLANFVKAYPYSDSPEPNAP